MRQAIVQLVRKVQDAVVGMGVRPDNLTLVCFVRGRDVTLVLRCGRARMCRVQFQLAAPVTPGLASVTQAVHAAPLPPGAGRPWPTHSARCALAHLWRYRAPNTARLTSGERLVPRPLGCYHLADC